MSKPQPPSAVEKLWKRYLRKRDIETRNRLVEHYAPLVDAHAQHLARKLPSQVQYDEIRSAAYDGLIEAVEAYDPSRKARFETFCQQRIRGAVMDWLRSLDMQSRTIRSFERRVAMTREILDAELGRPPDPGEIARRMGISRSRYEYLMRLSQLGREVHFSALEVATENDSGRVGHRFWDMGDRREADPAEKVSREMLMDYLTRGLSREERLVLILYYFENLTMAEIGQVLSLSESRVSQIHKEVLTRLRRRLLHETGEALPTAVV